MTTYIGQSFPLFTLGRDTASGDAIPLSVLGGSVDEGDPIPLFARGHQPKTTSFPFYAKVNEPPSAEASVSLFAFGSNGSGMVGYVPLYAYTDASGQTPYTSFPLFAAGAASHEVSGEIPLSVLGGTTRVEESLTLFALGPSGETAYVPMYASGEGHTPGAYPASLAVNLFIRRPLGEYIPMYALAPGEEINTEVAMVTLGKDSDEEAISLSLPEVVGDETQSVEMYTHGF